MELKNLPMSPTSNHAFKRGKFKDYPAKAMLDFKRDMSIWVLKNEYDLGVVRNHIIHQLNILPKPNPDKKELGGKVKFDRIFYFEKLVLFYKNGNRRRVDLTNRIKYLDDYLCKALNIDDSIVMSGAEDMYLDTTSYVNVIVTVIK